MSSSRAAVNTRSPCIQKGLTWGKDPRFVNIHLNDRQDCSWGHKGEGSIKVSNQLVLS